MHIDLSGYGVDGRITNWKQATKKVFFPAKLTLPDRVIHVDSISFETQMVSNSIELCIFEDDTENYWIRMQNQEFVTK
jgi:hypothetical protein